MEAVPWTVAAFKQRRRETWRAIRLWLLFLLIGSAGRKWVIWRSILGAAPFTLLLPYADLQWTLILVALIGLILASAFSAIVVFAQELIPNRIGMVSGLFFGLAFGFGGIGAAILGALMDRLGIESVFDLCAYVPLLGAVAFLLPDPIGPRSATIVWPSSQSEFL
jgi:MFS transporter, FSR family, fosmidomycin resistance protein